MNQNWEKFEARHDEQMDLEKAIDALLKNKDAERVKEENFSDVYGEDEIERDKKQVEAMESNFDKNLSGLNSEQVEIVKMNKRRSEALEVLLGMQVEMNNWFGENAVTVRVSKYDDIFNEVDVVVEFNIGEEGGKIERFALAVDASMRPDFHAVENKIVTYLSKVIKSEKMAKVKYFESQIDGYKGSLDTIVPVVVGLEGKNSDELIKECGELIKLQNIHDKSGEIHTKIQNQKNALEKHPAQMIFLKEIIMQLEMYEKSLAEKHFHRSEERKNKINGIRKIIEGIYSQKRETIKYDGLLDDGVFGSIKKFAERSGGGISYNR